MHQVQGFAPDGTWREDCRAGWALDDAVPRGTAPHVRRTTRAGGRAMTPLHEARGIVKRYGHVTALSGADFVVNPGEVVALIGDNGAGKSTLVKVLSGVIEPDEGQMLLRGEPIALDSPQHARSLGIETVFQDLALAPELGPAENAFIGREILKPGLLGRLGVLDKTKMRHQAFESFTSMGTDVKDVDAPVASLSGGQRQS